MMFGTKLSDFPIHIDRESIDRKSEEARARAREKLEGSAEYQNRKRMTQEERSRGAIDHLAKDMKRLAQEKGKEITWDEAKRYMTKIAQEAERQKK